ncbi:MAG: DUF3567 domain-containing protein [Lautropia sp.]|nr:MAG: DUF3567 domain-containing protein [Pseudomonadota bacterium]MBC6960618.1 DUF3567 domain-containing protein [Lautropia sp.]MCL4702909.1 DUF3567 family protein [Burkholderiaceae bacterium]MCZ2415075.1 DUF3567 domain-containing protein [Burkholderiales bacterium]MDL1907991.1 DUF3567 domain-containing protein [Betaproteobacteria bacterium PRO1]
MDMIYNSPSYCVVEFKDPEGQVGGFEIMDKLSRREIYIGGDLANHFRSGVQELIRSEPTEEQVDEFLRRFEGLMHQPMVMH